MTSWTKSLHSASLLAIALSLAIGARPLPLDTVLATFLAPDANDSGQLVVRDLRLPRTLQLIRQRIALLLYRAQRLRHCQVTLHTARIQLRLQGLNLGIFGRSRLLQLIGHLGLRQRYRIALVLFGQFQPLM